MNVSTQKELNIVISSLLNIDEIKFQAGLDKGQKPSKLAIKLGANQTHAQYLAGLKLAITEQEINEAYEKNTGLLIVNEFKKMKKDIQAVPAVLCKNHGPFTWGKDAHEAVHNAVVLEEVAKMASRCELINPDVKPAPQELQDKHYYRKHGANAYYGQVGQED